MANSLGSLHVQLDVAMSEQCNSQQEIEEFAGFLCSYIKDWVRDTKSLQNKEKQTVMHHPV